MRVRVDMDVCVGVFVLCVHSSQKNFRITITSWENSLSPQDYEIINTYGNKFVCINGCF